MGRSMSTSDGAIGGTDPAKNEADFLRRVAPPWGCGRRGRLDVLGVALDVIVGEAARRPPRPGQAWVGVIQ